MRHLSRSPAETEALGFDFAGTLGRGAVVALVGDLGTGKTCFVRGAVRALGVPGSVTSPTYSIVNAYSGAAPVFHMDAYRLKSEDEMVRIGFEDYLAQDGFCFIEWADRIPGLVPKTAARVYFTETSATEREIRIERGED